MYSSVICCDFSQALIVRAAMQHHRISVPVSYCSLHGWLAVILRCVCKTNIRIKMLPILAEHGWSYCYTWLLCRRVINTYAISIHKDNCIIPFPLMSRCVYLMRIQSLLIVPVVLISINKQLRDGPILCEGADKLSCTMFN